MKNRKIKQYKQLYQIPISQFIAYLKSCGYVHMKEQLTQGKIKNLKRSKFREFVQYIIKTSDIRNIKETKIILTER